MKRVFEIIKAYKKESVLGPLFKLLEALFELFIPLVVSDIIDNGIESGDRSYIIGRVLIMVALGLIGLVCSLTAQYFAAKAATGVAATLREKLFAKVMKLSDSDVDRLGTSTLITRITGDVNQIQSGLNLTLRLLLRSPFIVFGAMIMAFTIDVKSALIFVVTIPVLSIIVFGIIFTTAPLYKRVQGSLDEVTLSARENLSGNRVIRAFRREEGERGAFFARHYRLTKLQLFAGRISSLLNPLTFVVINAAVLVVIYVGGLRVDAGLITQGEVVALVNYMSQILVELIKLANLIITITKAVASANRVQEVLETDPGLVFATDVEGNSSRSLGTDSANDTAVVFENVSFAYPGALEDSLSDISFSVKKGETIGIIGGTGSGKSTLLNLIMRAYDPGSGEVSIFGRKAKDIPEKELKSYVSVVPQKAVLFRGTVKDNLLVGKEAALEEECLKALEASCSAEFVMSKGGLDCEVSQNGDNFSGGQKQRLSVARALVKNAPILLLDDSFSALDYVTEKNLKANIKSEVGASGRTTFIVSQRASTIRDADRIIVMDDGRIVGIGTSSELLESCGVYREIYYTQYETDK